MAVDTSDIHSSDISTTANQFANLRINVEWWRAFPFAGHLPFTEVSNQSLGTGSLVFDLVSSGIILIVGPLTRML